MNQRHKDIIKRLQMIEENEMRYMVSVVDAKTIQLTIQSYIDGVHHTLEINLDDILTIVRNVDIDEG